jgi:hypothetical protein
VDTGGLVLGARVHAGSLHDRDGARVLLSDELKELPRLELLWADAPTSAGFASGPNRSEVGKPRYRIIAIGSFGATGWRRSRAVFWLCRGGGWWRGSSPGSAKLDGSAKDYERLPETGVAMIH